MAFLLLLPYWISLCVVREINVWLQVHGLCVCVCEWLYCPIVACVLCRIIHSIGLNCVLFCCCSFCRNYFRLLFCECRVLCVFPIDIFGEVNTCRHTKIQFKFHGIRCAQFMYKVNRYSMIILSHFKSFNIWDNNMEKNCRAAVPIAADINLYS